MPKKEEERVHSWEHNKNKMRSFFFGTGEHIVACFGMIYVYIFPWFNLTYKFKKNILEKIREENLTNKVNIIENPHYLHYKNESTKKGHLSLFILKFNYHL